MALTRRRLKGSGGELWPNSTSASRRAPVSGRGFVGYLRRRRRCMRIVTVIAVTAAIVTVNVMINIRCLLLPKR
jgi:hypothetical protein